MYDYFRSGTAVCGTLEYLRFHFHSRIPTNTRRSFQSFPFSRNPNFLRFEICARAAGEPWRTPFRALTPNLPALFVLLARGLERFLRRVSRACTAARPRTMNAELMPRAPDRIVSAPANKTPTAAAAAPRRQAGRYRVRAYGCGAPARGAARRPCTADVRRVHEGARADRQVLGVLLAEVVRQRLQRRIPLWFGERAEPRLCCVMCARRACGRTVSLSASRSRPLRL